MKKLNRLGLLTGITTMTALSFSLGGCSDDPEPAGPTGGTPGVSGSTSSGGGGASAAGSKATGGGGSGSGGTPTAGTTSGGTGGGSAGGSGGSGGSGGGKASGGTGGTGGSGGGASGGSGGTGGGAAVSAACAKLCSGPDSIGTICAAEAMNVVSDSLKAKTTCETRCMKETMPADVTCWQTHATNAKNAAAAGDKTMHCGHAAGNSVCGEWPE